MTIFSKVMVFVLLLTGLAVFKVYDTIETPIPPRGEEHTLHGLQVLALGADDLHYEFRDERGTIFWGHFCNDYDPQFAPGMTLTVLTYKDMGDCWSVKDTHPAYLIKRDKKGRIIKEDFSEGRQEETQAH